MDGEWKVFHGCCNLSLLSLLSQITITDEAEAVFPWLLVVVVVFGLTQKLPLDNCRSWRTAAAPTIIIVITEREAVQRRAESLLLLLLGAATTRVVSSLEDDMYVLQNTKRDDYVSRHYYSSTKRVHRTKIKLFFPSHSSFNLDKCFIKM